MAIKLPERNYFTFSELMTRWQCSENDLRRLVIGQELKLSVRANGVSDVEWELNWLGKMVASGKVDGPDGNAPKGSLNRWGYLQYPHQTGAFECQFRLATDDREPEWPMSLADTPTFTTFWWLNNPLTLSKAVETAVFLNTEVAAFEAKHEVKDSQAVSDAPLKTRERNTLLTIIAVLCKEAHIDYKKAAAAAVSIDNTAALMGVKIGQTTIENHLKKISDALESRSR